MLRTVPSAEGDVADRWLRSAREGDATSGVYFALGQYDLFGIRRLSPGPSLSQAGTIPNILFSKDIDCYVWDCGDSMEAVLRQPLIAMVFIRHNPTHAQNGHSEVKTEQALAKGIKPNETTPRCFAGTWGWANNILIIGSSDVGELIGEARDAVKRCRSRKNPIYRKTYTMIGVDWSESCRSNVAVRYPIQATEKGLLGGAHVRVDMECRAANVLNVGWNARDRWKVEKGAKDEAVGESEVTVAFGPSDVQLRIPLTRYDTLGSLIEDITTFRRECLCSVRSTETRFEFPMDDRVGSRHEVGDPRNSTVEAIPIIDAETARAIATTDAEGTAILHSLYAYTHRLQDDDGDAVRDMLAFYVECYEIARRVVEERSSNDVKQREQGAARLKRLYALLEKGQIGQLQRNEQFLASRNSSTDLGPYRSGLRRILWAAQCIPWHIATNVLRVPAQFHVIRHGRAFKYRWRGFVIGGRLKDAFATFAPVLNVPAESLYHPEQWWGLSHELMHDFVASIPTTVLNFESPEWMESFKVPVPVAGKESEEKRICILLATECLCDALEFMCLGTWNWKAHQGVSWSLVLANLEQETDRERYVTEHLIRSVFAMRCSIKEHTERSSELLDELADFLRQGALQEQLPSDFDTLLSNTKHSVVVWSDALTERAQWIRALGRKKLFPDETVAQRHKWLNGKYEVCKKSLLDGSPVSPSDLEHPDLLIWKLRHDYLGKVLPEKAATAVIISLFWFYVERAPDVGGQLK